MNLDPDKGLMPDAETFDIDNILSNSLMLNPGALLTLSFEKMLYDNLRKMGKEGFISAEIFIYFLLILTQI